MPTNNLSNSLTSSEPISKLDRWSLAFDGTNDYVTMGNVLNLGTGDFTIAFWAKNDNWGSAENNYFISKYEDTNNRWYVRLKNDDPPRLQMYTKIGGTDSGKNMFFGDNTVGPSFDDMNGQWVHICISSDRDGLNKGYINNTLNDSDSGTAATMDNDGPLEIAKHDSTEFGGNISEVVIYNKALSASEVGTIYNGGDGYRHDTGVCSANLVGWWRMGDGPLDRFDDNGLICDNATTPSIGANLVTNGDFADATSTDSSSSALAGWTNGGDHTGAGQRVTIASGQATMVCDGTDIRLQQTILTSGKIYKYSIDIISNDGAGGTAIRLETGAGTEIKTLATGGTTYTGYFVADNTVIRIRRTGACNVTFDNVVIQEVSGNSGVMVNMAADEFEEDSP